MEEIFGWFPEANQRGLADLIFKYDVSTAIEIGSFLGRSAVWIADRIDHLWCIDPWEELETTPTSNNLVQTLQDLGLPNSFYHIFHQNIVVAGVESKVTALRGTSRDMIARAPRMVDLVYIDGDHSYEGCLADLLNYLPKARLVICGDDYHKRPNGEPYFPGVVQAVDEVFPEHGSDYTFWWKEL